MAMPVKDEESGRFATASSTKLPSGNEVQMQLEPVGRGDPHGGVFSGLDARLNSMTIFESRGVERVPLEERHAAKASDYMQMTLLWFSTNITANNMAVGMLGPLGYSLGFIDSALCATFGALLGAAGVAYMGTFGPVSGNRTMVVMSQ